MYVWWSESVFIICTDNESSPPSRRFKSYIIIYWQTCILFISYMRESVLGLAHRSFFFLCTNSPVHDITVLSSDWLKYHFDRSEYTCWNKLKSDCGLNTFLYFSDWWYRLYATTLPNIAADKWDDLPWYTAKQFTGPAERIGQGFQGNDKASIFPGSHVLHQEKPNPHNTCPMWMSWWMWNFLLQKLWLINQ